MVQSKFKAPGLIFLQAAVIAAATWWVYAPAIPGGWVWDDVSEITKNSVLRDPGGWWKAWLAPGALDYFPLKTAVQWVQWHLWGDRVAGYHLTNIGLHLLSAFLLWHLLRQLGVRLAWLGGLIFAVHPLAVESVAWISELKNVLSLPLLLGAMVAYISYDERRWYQSSMGFQPMASSDMGWKPMLLFLAAMLCKSSVVMFPFVLLLYSWWKRGRITWTDVRASMPFFAISAALGLVTVWFQYHRAIGDLAISQGGFSSRLAVAGLSVVFYFWKFIWPVGLLPVYPRWAVDPPALWQFWPWVAAAIATIFICRWSGLSPTRFLAPGGEGAPNADEARSGQHAPPSIAHHVLFGLGFFLINLVPVLGLIPMSYMRFSWVADHFAYLPMVGLVGLGAAGLGALFKVAPRQVGASSTTAGGTPALPWFVIAAVIAALAIDSRRHAEIFKDETTLWTTTLQRSPGSWLAQNNLGDVLSREGRTREAMGYFEAAVRLNPEYPEAQDNLGVALVAAGRLPEAMAHYEQALRLKPDFPAAEFNFGLALHEAGRPSEAIVHFERALRLKPDFAEADNALGVVLLEAGRRPEAIAHFERALQLNPSLAAARHNLELVSKKPF